MVEIVKNQSKIISTNFFVEKVVDYLEQNKNKLNLYVRSYWVSAKNNIEEFNETIYLIGFDIKNGKNISVSELLKNIGSEIYNNFKQKPVKFLAKSLISSGYLEGKFRFLRLICSLGSVYFLKEITVYREKAKKNISGRGVKNFEGQTQKENRTKINQNLDINDIDKLKFNPIEIKPIPVKYKIVAGDKRRRNIIRKAILIALALGLTVEAVLYLLKHLGYVDSDLADAILELFSTFFYYLGLAYETIINYIKGFIGITELEDRLDNVRRALESHTNMLASQDTRIKTLLARLESIKENINKDLIFKIKTETKRELQKDLRLSRNDIVAEIIKEVEAAIASQSRELSGLFQKRFDNVQKELFESLSKKIMEELEIQKTFQELETKKASSTPLKEGKKSNPLLETKKSKPLPVKIDERKISERLKQKRLENAKKFKNTNVTKE